MALITSTGNGAQTSTQSPQVGGSATSTAAAGSVQPGTATSVLNSTNGVSLKGTSLTTVNLSSAVSATAKTQPPAKEHHLHPAALGFSLLLFAIAISLFWLTARPRK